MDNPEDEGNSKPACRYGSECYQRNKQHLEKFKHPRSSTEKKEEPDSKKPRKAAGPLKQQTLNLFFQTANKGSHATNSENTSSTKPSQKETKIEEPTPTNSRTTECSKNASPRAAAISESANNRVDEFSEATSSNVAAVAELSVDEYQRIIRKLFLVDMPADFFSFWEFCENLSPGNPSEALQSLDLSLVGPYDVLSGLLTEDIDTNTAVRHWRYFYDPPEFQTVLKSNKSDLFHIGYYRDDPNTLPVFVGYNYASKNASITSIGENIFTALNWCVKHCESIGTPFKKVKLTNIKTELLKWADTHHFSLDNYTENMRKRDKVVVAKTFHHAGIVVPYNKETELGYRPLSVKATELTKMMKLIDTAQTEEERVAHWAKLHEVINWADIATDEGDYGTILELGIDLFCFDSQCFNNKIIQLLTSAYRLLGRESFSAIIEAHLQDRKKGGQLSAVPKKNTSLRM